jgi:hypothetical protein
MWFPCSNLSLAAAILPLAVELKQLLHRWARVRTVPVSHPFVNQKVSTQQSKHVLINEEDTTYLRVGHVLPFSSVFLNFMSFLFICFSLQVRKPGKDKRQANNDRSLTFSS